MELLDGEDAAEERLSPATILLEPTAVIGGS